MKDLLILSRSLSSLAISAVSSASGAFELGFATAMSSHIRTTILSRGAATADQAANGALRLEPMLFPKSLRKSILGLVHESRMFTNGGAAIIYGYDPRDLMVLKYLSLRNGFDLVPYVFDHHGIAVDNQRSMVRGRLMNAYFACGIKLLKGADGVLLLNPSAYRALGLRRVPSLTSRVGVENWSSLARSPQQLDRLPFRIMFAGSLESINLVSNLVKAMDFIDNDEIELHIFGSGSQQGTLRKQATGDRRITFHGRVGKPEVDAFGSHVDLLVNPRDMAHPLTLYSFPSKLVEYMASGVPVLSPPVVESAEFRACVLVTDRQLPEDMAKAILLAKAESRAQAERATLALDYVRHHHSWPDIAREVSRFLVSL